MLERQELARSKIYKLFLYQGFITMTQFRDIIAEVDPNLSEEVRMDPIVIIFISMAIIAIKGNIRYCKKKTSLLSASGFLPALLFWGSLDQNAD